jgi:hypothetical protein
MRKFPDNVPAAYRHKKLLIHMEGMGTFNSQEKHHQYRGLKICAG